MQISRDEHLNHSFINEVLNHYSRGSLNIVGENNTKLCVPTAFHFTSPLLNDIISSIEPESSYTIIAPDMSTNTLGGLNELLMHGFLISFTSDRDELYPKVEEFLAASSMLKINMDRRSLRIEDSFKSDIDNKQKKLKDGDLTENLFDNAHTLCQNSPRSEVSDIQQRIRLRSSEWLYGTHCLSNPLSVPASHITSKVQDYGELAEPVMTFGSTPLNNGESYITSEGMSHHTSQTHITVNESETALLRCKNCNRNFKEAMELETHKATDCTQTETNVNLAEVTECDPCRTGHENVDRVNGMVSSEPHARNKRLKLKTIKLLKQLETSKKIERIERISYQTKEFYVRCVKCKQEFRFARALFNHLKTSGHANKVDRDTSELHNNDCVKASTDVNRNSVLPMFRCPWRFCEFRCRGIGTATTHLQSKHKCSEEVALEYVKRSCVSD